MPCILLKTERQQSAPPALPCRVPNHDEDPSRRRSWRSPCRPPGPGRRPFLDVEGLRAAPARSGEPGTGAVPAPRQRAEVDVHHPRLHRLRYRRHHHRRGCRGVQRLQPEPATQRRAGAVPGRAAPALRRPPRGDHRAQRAPGAEHRRGLPQAAGGDRPHGDAQGPRGDVAAADRYALALRSGDGCPGRRLRVLVAHRAAHQRGDGAQRTLRPGVFQQRPGTRADQGTDPGPAEQLQRGPAAGPWRAPAALPAARPRVSPGQRPRDPEPGGRGTRRRGLAVQAVRGLPSLLRGVADELPEALPARRGARGDPRQRRRPQHLDDRPGLGLQPPRTLLRGLPQALRGNPEHDPAPRCAALLERAFRRPRGRSAPGSAAGAGSRRPGAG